MRPLPLFNVVTFWWGSNVDDCAEKLSQILVIKLVMVEQELLPVVM